MCHAETGALCGLHGQARPLWLLLALGGLSPTRGLSHIQTCRQGEKGSPNAGSGGAFPEHLQGLPWQQDPQPFSALGLLSACCLLRLCTPESVPESVRGKANRHQSQVLVQ